MFVALRSKTFSWANGNLFLLCLSPLSKQEAARAEYKRLKREMMETKRKKGIEEEKHSGEIFLYNLRKFTWVSLLQAFSWWKGLNCTRGEYERRPPLFLVNLSPALSVLSEHQEQAIPELVQFSYRAQDCKNALMKEESYYGTKVKTVGVSSVKMPMRVILHWIPNPSLYNPSENVKFTVLFKTLISPASNVVLQRTTMQRYNRSPGWLHFMPTIWTRASYLNCVTFFTLTYLTFCPLIVWFYLEYNTLLCTNSNVFFSLLVAILR